MKKSFLLFICTFTVFLLLYFGKCIYSSHADLSKANSEISLLNTFPDAWQASFYPFLGPGNVLSMFQTKEHINDFFVFESIRHLRHSLDWNVKNLRAQDLLMNLARIEDEKGRVNIAQNIRAEFFSAKNAAQGIDYSSQKMSYLWAFIAIIFFLVWVVSTLLLIAKGFNKAGKVKTYPLFSFLILSFLSLCFWLLALHRVS